MYPDSKRLSNKLKSKSKRAKRLSTGFSSPALREKSCSEYFGGKIATKPEGRYNDVICQVAHMDAQKISVIHAFQADGIVKIATVLIIDAKGCHRVYRRLWPQQGIIQFYIEESDGQAGIQKGRIG